MKPKIHGNTLLSTLSRREITRMGWMAIRWCKKTMGINNRKQYELKVHFTLLPEEPLICGEYEQEENEIHIYYRNCKDVRELLRTIIHEWKHTLQPLRTQYYKHKVPYYQNPFEKEARAAEREMYPLLWEAIKGKVNR